MTDTEIDADERPGGISLESSDGTTLFESRRTSIRGMTMRRILTIGPLVYEFDRTQGIRRLTIARGESDE